MQSLHIPALVIALYGPDNPYHVWAAIFTICVVACLPRTTRRAGGISLFVAGAMMGVSVFVQNVFVSFTPH